MELLSVSHWHDVLTKRLAGYPPFLPDVITGFSVGLIVGFLLSTFGRYLILGLLLTAAFLWVADYLNLVTIHSGQIEVWLGMQPFNSLQDLSTYLSTLVKDHVAGVGAAIIGFLLGWKLGF